MYYSSQQNVWKVETWELSQGYTLELLTLDTVVLEDVAVWWLKCELQLKAWRTASTAHEWRAAAPSRSFDACYVSVTKHFGDIHCFYWANADCVFPRILDCAVASVQSSGLDVWLRTVAAETVLVSWCQSCVLWLRPDSSWLYKARWDGSVWKRLCRILQSCHLMQKFPVQPQIQFEVFYVDVELGNKQTSLCLYCHTEAL